MFSQGILGGCFFALANLLIPTVVNTLGLGVGFMLWNGANIAMGYLVSRYGTYVFLSLRKLCHVLPSIQVSLEFTQQFLRTLT